MSARPSGGPLDNGPVGLSYLARLKLFGEAPRRLRVAREDDDAGDGPVEAVRDAEVDVALFLIALFQIRLGHRFQRGNAWRHALRQQRRRLGDDETVVVFVDDGEWVGHGVLR